MTNPQATTPELGELKPCPFCGGSTVKVVEYARHHEIDDPRWWAGCTRCDAGVDSYSDNSADAIAAWNTRLSRPVGDYVVERLSTTLLMARSWVNNHASHCLSLVAPQAEDGPYNQCNCCLPEKLEVIDAALSSIPVSTEAVDHLGPKFVKTRACQCKPYRGYVCPTCQSLAAEPTGEVVQTDRLVEAVQAVIDGACRTYTARNGRQCSIQADDGEACEIVHSDLIFELSGALQAFRDHRLAFSRHGEGAQIVAWMYEHPSEFTRFHVGRHSNGYGHPWVETPLYAVASTPSNTADQTDREKVLEDALRDLVPSALCGESWNLPDNEHVAIDTTFGKLKAARTALAETDREKGA